MDNWFSRVIDAVRGNQNVVIAPVYTTDDKNVKGSLTSPEWVTTPMFGSPRRIDYGNLEEYENNVYVQAAVNYIIDSVSGKDYEIVNDSDKEIDTTEVDNFFKSTYWERSFKTNLRALISDILLYDSGVFVVKFPEGCYDDQKNLIRTAKPIELTALDGRSFIKKVTVNGIVENYFQYSFLAQATTPVQFEPAEILYIQEHPSTRSPYGTSKLNTVKDVADYLTAVAQGHRAGIENGMTPGGVIKHPNVTDPERLKQLSAMYNSKLQGEYNAKKWLVSGGEVDFIPIDTAMADDTWIDGSTFYLHTILSIFKVPASVLGFPGDVNKATSDTQNSNFKTNGVGVMTSLIEEVLTREIVKKYFNAELSFRFASETDLNDELMRAEIDQKNIQSGVTTVNEVRISTGKDPIEEKEPEIVEVAEKSLSGEDWEQSAVDMILKLNEEQEMAILRELERLYVDVDFDRLE